MRHTLRWYHTPVQDLFANSQRCITPYLVKTITKHGKRSADSALLSVVMSKADKAALQELARQDGRSASKFAARELAKIVAAHLAKTQAPAEASPHDPELAVMLREMQSQVAPIIARIRGADRPQSAKNVQKSFTTK